ncbi:cytochrome c oxidase assembly protein [Planosporangium thailandense]|uniref:Cytochrome c oxidase assembly protein n=1 Tax=Planosporangium thailandense TaxID=765197 RepID=A0ABX0Y5R8_9ACTN|nr:cytochrome c oxidase assembly protein [Planosporangium thailandense]
MRSVPAVADLLSYGGPPPPTLAGAASAWRLDPLLLAVALLAAVGYLAGVARVHRAGGRWPVARTAVFVGLGLTGLAVSALGWPEVYAPVLFSVYAGQVMLLLLVVPFLLALGRPIGLAQAALGPTGRARLTAALDSRWARFFTVPVVSPLLLAAVPFLIFFTPLYRFSLTHAALLSILHLLLLALGAAVLLPVWESDTVDARIPYVIVTLFAFIELLADAVPGIVIRLDTHPIAAGYFAMLARPWGPSPIHDQQLGGDLMWCVGEAIDLPFIVMLLVQWVRSDARDAVRVDRELDAIDAAERAAVGAGPIGAGPVGADDAGSDDGMTRPWWEADASIFGDRAARYQRPPAPRDGDR